MHFSDDSAHAQRLYDYISRLWFMPATPVLSNGGTTRGLPISCFLNEASDSLEGILGLWNENVWLAARGGGIGSYWGNLRSIGEKVGMNGKTSGVVPFKIRYRVHPRLRGSHFSSLAGRPFGNLADCHASCHKMRRVESICYRVDRSQTL